MKKNIFEKINIMILNIIIVSIMVIFFSYNFLKNGQYSLFFISIICLAIYVLINVFIKFIRKKIFEDKLKDISFDFDNNKSFKVPGAIYNFGLPLAFLSDNGELLFSNDLLEEMFESGTELKSTLSEIFYNYISPKIELLANDLSFETSIGGKDFLVKTAILNQFSTKNVSFSVMLYFIDKSNEKSLKKLYDSQRIAVGEIVVDSYEEIYQKNGEIVINSINVELSKYIDKWLNGKKAIAKKMVRDRFFIVMEYEALQEIMKDKFSILANVKQINVGNSIPITLSIGISVLWDSVVENESNIPKAIESVVSKGGDQAVVMCKGKNDEYFGAGNVELESLNEVKARVVSQKLKEIIKESSKVLIMGHAIPETDMDSLGACLAAYRAATLLNKKAKIVLKEGKETLKVMMDEIAKHPEYNEVFINTSMALAICDPDTLLIVVDVSDAPRSEAPRLVETARKIVVIDHHRRGNDYIRNTLLDYNEVTASSTSELMVEILKYMHPGLTIPKVEAEAMYAGILVDTKNLVFKTGRRTFAAASFLRGQNVDTVAVRKYTQPDLDTFLEISNISSNAKIYFDKVAISKAKRQLKNKDLVISVAADQMLNVLGIEASFVLYEQEDGNVKITARSLGDINVQVIMSKMGGGGHLTAAATIIRDGTNIENIEKLLIDNIKKYLYS